MASSEHDIVFSWVSGGDRVYRKFRIVRNAEDSYRERWVRSEITQQLLSQSETPALQSRPDSAAMYQKSWAGGATWWKPLLVDPVDNYFQSNHMDVWSEPGKVVPMNQVSDAANTQLHDNCVIALGVASGVNTVFAIGSTEIDTSGFLDVYVRTNLGTAFARHTGLNSGVPDTDEPMQAVYDPADGYIYVLTDNPEVVRFSSAAGDEDAAWITSGFNIYPGCNIFLQGQNLMFYSGDQIYSIDKTGTPSVSVEFNDGMGPDLLDQADFTGSNPLFRKNVKLAISTPEGIYYVKNTRQGGQPVPWIFRVDRDSAGNWIGSPIGTLPVGSVALGITHHLGQLLISTTPNWQTAFENDTNEAEIELYFIGEAGMGALGSLLGGRDELDETPYAFLGSSGPYLYIGGQKRLWVYDGIRGGLHTAWEWGTELSDGAYVEMAWTIDGDGDSAMYFLGKDRIAETKTSKSDDPDTVTDFGDDETTYVLESNFFDANLPLEVKRLAKLEILYDPATGTAADPNQEWTVQISVDDGAFADAITVTDNDMTSGYSATGPVDPRGRKFQYRLIYQTKTAVKKALKSILATFTTGEMVREWHLLLDLAEVRNVNNEIIDEEQVKTDLRFMMDDTNEDLISLLDNYNNTKEVDTEDSTGWPRVKFQSLEIIQDKPTEGMARVVIREHPFDTRAT